MAETENFALEVIKRIHHELGTENSADKLKLVYKNHCRRNSVCVGGHLCQGR